MSELSRLEQLNREAQQLVTRNERLLDQLHVTMKDVEKGKAFVASWKIALDRKEEAVREITEINLKHSEELKAREEAISEKEEAVAKAIVKANEEFAELDRARADLEVQKCALTVAMSPVRDAIKEILLMLELETDQKVIIQELQHKHDLYEAKW